MTVMIDTKHIRISDYNYPLPDERIAKFPIAQRDHSKMSLFQNKQQHFLLPKS